MHSHSTTGYRLVPGFPSYRVNAQGDVQSCKPLNGRYKGGRPPRNSDWRQLKPHLFQNGYLYVHLCSEAKTKHPTAVHRLVLLAFVGPCPAGMHALHADDNKTINRLSNLRWGTPKENHEDAIRNGRTPRGEHVATAKLTEADVRAIRKRLASGDSHRKIAKDFGVSANPIRDIALNVTWRHVQ